LILLAHPFSLVCITLCNRAHQFYHCHILQVVAVVYEELARKTNRFSILNLTCDQETLSLSHSLSCLVINGFSVMHEYRAVIYFGQVLDELWGEAWEHLLLQGTKPLVQYVFAHLKLGNYEAALAVAYSNGASDRHITTIREGQTQHTGTSGKFTAMVTLSKDVYSPPSEHDSDSSSSSSDVPSHICILCGADAVGRCHGCQQPDYCSRECQRTHWYSHHRTVCPGPKTIGQCRVCGTAGNIGCSWCADEHAVYCGRECRVKDWESVHSGECSQRFEAFD
jgi:MYND finger